MNVKDVMTRNVRTVPPEASIFQIAKIMRDEDIGAVPVADGDRLVGMVTDRDIVTRALADSSPSKNLSAREVMSDRVLYCFEDQGIEEVLANMGEQQVRRLPVVDKDKRLVGVVSLGDLSCAGPAARAGESLGQISETRH
jgi:CBS domain-containing protein